MRMKHLVLPCGAALALAGCASSSPKPQDPYLARHQDGGVTQADYDAWLYNTDGTGLGRADRKARFDDLVRFHLEALAAKDDSTVGGDSTLLLRWLSVSERVVSERYRMDVLNEHYGVHDTAIDRWVAEHDSLRRRLPEDSLRSEAARSIALGGLNLDSIAAARRPQLHLDSATSPDSVRSAVARLLLAERSRGLAAALIPSLRKQYGVQLETIVRPEPSADSLRDWWKAKADSWTGQEMFVLSALGSHDSASLAKALRGVKDLAGFRKLATRFPVGTPAAPQGILGRVKAQFALPYGIGMAPALFERMNAVPTGMVAPLKLRDSLWLAVWVEQRVPATIKPFESVREEVKASWLVAHPWKPAPEAVIATWDKGPLFTRSDLDFVASEIPPQVRRQYPDERVLDYMIGWRVVFRASKETGHLDRPRMRRSLKDNQRVWWAQQWRRSDEAQRFLLPDSVLKTAYARWKDSLGLPKPAGQAYDSLRDPARLAIMPGGYLFAKWSETRDQFLRDSAIPPYDSVRAQVFLNQRADLDRIGHLHMDTVLAARYGLVRTELAPRAEPAPAKERLDSARSQFNARKLEPAETLYQSVADDETAADSLREDALFSLGQLHSERQEWLPSLAAFRRLLFLFPKGPMAYKAQFMIAFTYSEYLKKDKAALVEYRKMLTDYAGSDLSDDADWMIRNIESGGALMPKFDDIPADEPASPSTPAEHP